jgi:uncharacterized membrane protein YtjA (UPF0391 family)
MLGLALTFLGVALVAGILGFGGLGTGWAGPAQGVFFLAVAGFTGAMVANALRSTP